ncbi:hypothetical protein L9F63_002249, partial [Diploptera punctata]
WSYMNMKKYRNPTDIGLFGLPLLLHPSFRFSGEEIFTYEGRYFNKHINSPFPHYTHNSVMVCCFYPLCHCFHFNLHPTLILFILPVQMPHDMGLDTFKFLGVRCYMCCSIFAVLYRLVVSCLVVSCKSTRLRLVVSLLVVSVSCLVVYLLVVSLLVVSLLVVSLIKFSFNFDIFYLFFVESFILHYYADSKPGQCGHFRFHKYPHIRIVAEVDVHYILTTVFIVYVCLCVALFSSLEKHYR